MGDPCPQIRSSPADPVPLLTAPSPAEAQEFACIVVIGLKPGQEKASRLGARACREIEPGSLPRGRDGLPVSRKTGGRSRARRRTRRHDHSAMSPLSCVRPPRSKHCPGSCSSTDTTPRHGMHVRRPRRGLMALGAGIAGWFAVDARGRIKQLQLSKQATDSTLAEAKALNLRTDSIATSPGHASDSLAQLASQGTAREQALGEQLRKTQAELRRVIALSDSVRAPPPLLRTRRRRRTCSCDGSSRRPATSRTS